MRSFNTILLVSLFLVLEILGNDYYSFRSATEKSKVVHLFCHGLGGDLNQMIHYVNVPATTSDNKPFARDYCLVEGSAVSFNFPEIDTDGNRNQALTDLGQELDIAALHKAYLKTRAEFADHDIVLICVSRGAVAAINFVAKYKPAEVKALILESPFDHPASVVQRLLDNHYVGWVPGLKNIGISFMKKNFPKLNFGSQGIFPCTMVKQLPTHLPIMLIHSKKDRLIPTESSKRLYKLLLRSGHTDAALVIVDEGSHANVLWDKNGPEYQKRVRDFLQKYNLLS